MSDVFDLSNPVPTSSSPSVSSAKPETILDRLKANLSKKVERPLQRIEVPERPSVSVQFDPNITQQQLKAWRKQAGEGTSKDGIDAAKFSLIVVSQTCRGIFLDDEQVYSEEGAPLTFASPEIKAWLDADTPTRAVVALFGVEPHVQAACVAILDAAGFGDSVDTVEDPLKDS